MKIEEEAVGPGANDGKCGGVDQKGGTDSCQTEYYVDVLNAFGQKRVLNIEVQVERGMHGHESCDNSAEEAMVGVQFLMGKTGEVLYWRPRFKRQCIMERQLGCSHYSKPSSNMEVV